MSIPPSLGRKIDLLDEAEANEYLENVCGVIDKCVTVMPTQADFITANCAAPPTRGR